MNRIRYSALAAALAALVIGTAAPAAERSMIPAETSARTTPGLLAQAVERLRLERQHSLKADARRALAQMRSETASALAQGSVDTTTPTVRTSP